MIPSRAPSLSAEGGEGEKGEKRERKERWIAEERREGETNKEGGGRWEKEERGR